MPQLLAFFTLNHPLSFMYPEEHLDKHLDEWDAPYEADPFLSSRVNERIAMMQEAERERFSAKLAYWFRELWANPVFVTGSAIALLVMGIVIGRNWEAQATSVPAYMSANYRLSIDPMYRLQTAGVSEVGNEAPLSLMWFEDTLGLDETQIDEISAIHVAYRTRFDELFFELAALQRSFMEFDRQRMRTDVIDYMAYRDLMDKQAEAQGAANQATDELLKKVVAILAPEQRQQFIELLDKAQPSSQDDSEAATNA